MKRTGFWTVIAALAWLQFVLGDSATAAQCGRGMSGHGHGDEQAHGGHGQQPGREHAAHGEQATKVGKNGEIQFRTEVQVGELMLKPGRYRIQHRVEGEDHFVHFTEVSVPVRPTGVERTVGHPGEVKCRLEPLNKKASQTSAYTMEDKGVRRLTRVEIEGENVAHIF